MSDSSFVSQAASQALHSWGLDDAANSEEIASLVSDGTAYWQQDLSDGAHLSLIRLFSPVVKREEVFLGNILLNGFLGKSLIRAVENRGIGKMKLLANDLENYYYLYHGKSSLERISDSFRQEVLASLPDLYFGDEDPNLGIYGDVGRMLTFRLANREPFPIFVVPNALLLALLNKVNSHLRALDVDSFDVQRTIATLSFFYARGTRNVNKFDKKKGEYVRRSVSEMQSDFAFLLGAEEDGLLPCDTLKKVFVLGEGEELDEQVYRDRKKSGTFDRMRFISAISTFLSNIEEMVENEGLNSLASLYEKALIIELPELADKLLQGVQVGFLGFIDRRVEGLPCRFCGTCNAIVREKTIVAGTGMTKFFNPAAKLPHPKQTGRESLCMRCGISAYLETKLLGMMFADDMPIPRQHNIVFHYGHHDETELCRLRDTIDDIFDLIGTFRQKAFDEKKPFSLESVKDEIVQRAAEREKNAELSSAEEAFLDLISDDNMAPGLEILAQTPQTESAQILSLGEGDYRLLVFIIPRLQPGRRDALDFVNHRLSRSRLATFTLLALLRKICGCDGPYYFQSVPSLSLGGFNSNTFYVQGHPESATEAINRYSLIVNFARKVSKYRDGHSRLADWIILADKMETDPLGTFSDVLRNSPLRAEDDLRDAKYYRLNNNFIKGTRMIDGKEYLKMIDQLKQLQ